MCIVSVRHPIWSERMKRWVVEIVKSRNELTEAAYFPLNEKCKADYFYNNMKEKEG